MEKRTIGKIQIILGVILLLGGIVRLSRTVSWFDKQVYEKANFPFDRDNQKYVNYSNETLDILESQYVGIKVEGIVMELDIALAFGLFFVVSILLSLLFITQGFANMANEVKR